MDVFQLEIFCARILIFCARILIFCIVSCEHNVVYVLIVPDSSNYYFLPLF